MPVSSNCVYFSLFNRINRFLFRKRNSFVDTISGCVPQLFLQNSVGRNRGSKSVKASDTLFSLFSIYTFRTPVSVCLSLSVCVCVCVCVFLVVSVAFFEGFCSLALSVTYQPNATLASLRTTSYWICSDFDKWKPKFWSQYPPYDMIIATDLKVFTLYRST